MSSKQEVSKIAANRRSLEHIVDEGPGGFTNDELLELGIGRGIAGPLSDNYCVSEAARLLRLLDTPSEDGATSRRAHELRPGDRIGIDGQDIVVDRLNDWSSSRFPDTRRQVGIVYRQLGREFEKAVDRDRLFMLRPVAEPSEEIGVDEYRAAFQKLADWLDDPETDGEDVSGPLVDTLHHLGFKVDR